MRARARKTEFTMKSKLTTVLIFVGWIGLGADLPTTLPPHPRLLFTRSDVSQIQQRMANHGWARARFDSLRSQADGWLKTEVRLPARGGQWFHYYSCPTHGARLRTESPTRHVCPIDGDVLSGYPYDDVYLMTEHNRLAGAVRTLGIVHQLTGQSQYAAKAREILLAYAAKYHSYPLHTIRGEEKVGGGKVGPQTLDESTWLITMVEGADCIWDTLAEDEKKKIEERLLRPAVAIIRQHKMKIHNIQCWKNSAVGLAGLLLGDMKLVDEALHGESGYFEQMSKGMTADGAWYEGAWGYHFYTVSAVAHLTEGAFHSGINLYGPEFKRMFDAPIAFAMPDFQLPAFNDSHALSVLSNASLYEIAFARYLDDHYRAVLARTRRDSDMSLLAGRDEVGAASEFIPTSRNFPASGYAILAGGKGKEASWLCLDYGPHGGGHGHPDKLGFVLYGLGQVIVPDPGTANYGVPIQGGWYRTTIAHSTLTVDENSQSPAEGKCDAFLTANGFSAVSATAGKIYRDVSFRRTIAMVGDNLLVCIDQVRALREHTFDLAYHNAGRCAGPATAQPFQCSTNPGYSYFREAKSLSGADGLDLRFDLGHHQEVRWSMAGGQPTTFILATGVGAHTEERVPLVLARCQGKELTRAWCITLGAPAEAVTLTEEPIKLMDGSPTIESGVAAIRIRRRADTHILVTNPLADEILVAGQRIRARLAHFVSSGGAEVKVQCALE